MLDSTRLAHTDQPERVGVKFAGLFAILEKVFVILALLVYAGSLINILGHNPEAAAGTAREDIPFLRAIYAGVYAVTFLLLILRSKHLTHLITREPLLLFLAGFAMVSVLWSVDPSLTLRQGIAVLGTTLFGIYLAVRFSFREQLWLLAWALGIAALLSVAFVLALPSYGVMVEARGEVWRGVFTHKNTLGRLMALSAIVFLILAIGGLRYRAFLWTGFGLSLGLLLMSSSKTALVALLLVLIVLPLCKTSQERFTLAVPILIVMVLVGGAAVTWILVNAESTLALFGRDTTFTGRTEIWAAVLDMIWRRPWLGYGYGAFWQGYAGESAYVWLVLPQNNYPTHAHNGFLDLWLDLGLLGLLMFVALLLLAFGRAIAWMVRARSAEGFWPLALLAFTLFCSLAYPVGLERNSIWWVLFVATVLSLAIQSDRTKRSQLYNRARQRRIY